MPITNLAYLLYKKVKIMFNIYVYIINTTKEKIWGLQKYKFLMQTLNGIKL